MPVNCTREMESKIITTGTMLIAGNPGFRRFEKELQASAKSTFSSVIIDFSECIYIDSHAITAIINLNRRLQLTGKKLRLQNANKDINELLRAIQLNRIITLQ